jgi:hypothetical protein
MQAIDSASQGGPDTPGPIGPTDPSAAPDAGGPTGGAQNPVEALQNALAALEEYQGLEQDQVDLAEAAKVYAMIQKLLAKDQQEREAAAGVTPVHRGLAKAQASAAPPGGGPGYGP